MEDKNSVIQAVYLLAAFFMWFKLIYYLRFRKEFGKFVKMIFGVIYSISTFIVFLIISFIGFSFAYQIAYELKPAVITTLPAYTNMDDFVS